MPEHRVAGLVGYGSKARPPRYMTDPEFEGVITLVRSYLEVGDLCFFGTELCKIVWISDEGETIPEQLLPRG